MQNKKIIKVLVVDDSLIFRESIAQGLNNDPDIEVVATAVDAYSARDSIVLYQPDVMTLDVEMPKMNGIEFLRRLMPQHPIPVVVVSSVSENIFEALSAGAVDFVSKPGINYNKTFASLLNELIVKVKIASTAKVSHYKNNKFKAVVGTNNDANQDIIAIGASTGGTEAIAYILQSFPRDMPGIVIVQHMPAVFTKMYADRLNNLCLLEIREAQDGDQICAGRVLIAAGDFHMGVIKSGNSYSVKCYKGGKVNGHCPSVDVLFYSVAEHYASRAVGVILTGMGSDGAKGLMPMRNRGASTIGQNEESCVVYGMPCSAFNLGAVDQQLPLNSIPQAINSIISKRAT